MADLAAELAYRNARLRAWKAHGVPVEGGWGEISFKSDGKVYALLILRCETCLAIARGAATEVRYLEVTAARVVGEIACSHLAPLIGADPPEVVALTKLELLAGDPPG